MDTDGALVIDLRRPDWASDSTALVADLAANTPAAIRLEANDAAAPSAEEAQLLLFLVRHAEALGLPVSLHGLDDEVRAGMARIGLPDVLPAEGDATP